MNEDTAPATTLLAVCTRYNNVGDVERSANLFKRSSLACPDLEVMEDIPLVEP